MSLKIPDVPVYDLFGKTFHTIIPKAVIEPQCIAGTYLYVIGYYLDGIRGMYVVFMIVLSYPVPMYEELLAIANGLIPEGYINATRWILEYRKDTNSWKRLRI